MKKYYGSIDSVLTTFSICLALYICIYYGTTEYFISSPMIISDHIIKTGQLPDRIFTNPVSIWMMHANQYTSYNGASIIMASLNMVSGIEIYFFRYFPLLLLPFLLIVKQIFLIPFRLKVLSRKYFRSVPFVLYSVYITTSAAHQWRMSYQALGFISHVMILYMIIKVIIKENCKFKSTDIFLIIIFFSISLLNYYTMSTITIIFILSLAISILLFENKINYSVKLLFILSIVLTILYINYDVMWTYSVDTNKADLFDLPSIFFNSIMKYILGRPSSEELFAYGFTIDSTVEDKILNFINHISIGVTPLILLVILVKKTNNSKFKLQKYLYFLIIAALAASLWEMFPYLLVYGVINIRYLIRFTTIINLFTIFYMINNNTIKNLKAIMFILLILFIASISYQIKVPFLRDNVGGFGSQKLELSSYPEYNSLASLFASSCPIYSNFQVSGEIWLASINIGRSSEVFISPLQNKIYALQVLSIDNDIVAFETAIGLPSMLVLTDVDFSRPVWGDFHGFTIRPLASKVMPLLGNSSCVLFVSDRTIVYSFS